jgi:hypothetical protein
VNDLVSAATIQVSIASGAFGDGFDDYRATLRTAREKHLRVKSQRTHYEETGTLISSLLGSPPSGRLTVIMVYCLGWKCPDGKGIRDNPDGSSGFAVLASGGGVYSG